MPVFPIITPAQVTLDGNYYNYTENVQTNQTLTNPTLNVQSFTNPNVIGNCCVEQS